MHASIKWVLKNRVFVLLILIVAFAFYLRVYALGDSGMWTDETISAVVSREIVEKGYPELDSGFFYVRGIVFHYLMAGVLLFFNNDFGARFVSVLFGVGSVILCFFIAREFKVGGVGEIDADGVKRVGNSGGVSGKNAVGLIAAFLCAVLFLEVAYSRQARFYQMFQFLFFLSLFFLYKSRERKGYGWLACLSLVLLVNTHIAGIVIVPMFIYLFYTEQKDWKLFVIPLLICLWYTPEVLGVAVNNDNGEIIGNYIENYSSSLFYYLRAFFIICLLGLPFAWKWNKRLTMILLVPSVVLFVLLFFVKVYALRYAYFVVLLTPIFTSTLFYFIYRNSKIFFFIALSICVIYPSNIFYETGNLTVILPESVQMRTASEPVIGYKDLSMDVQERIMKSETLVLFTPGFAWYYKNPDYFIPFSLNGLESGYEIYNDLDAYTGSKKFDYSDREIIFLEDFFGYSKLNSASREKIEKFKEGCELLEEKTLLRVYSC